MTKPAAAPADGELEGQLLTLLRGLVRSEVRAAMSATGAAEPASAARDYLTTRNAAKYASVAPGTIRRWIHEGRLAASHAGRYHRVKRTDLDQMLRNGDAGTTDDKSPEELARETFRSLRSGA